MVDYEVIIFMFWKLYFQKQTLNLI